MKTLLAFLLLSTVAYGQWYSDVDMIAMQVQSPIPYTDWNDFSFSERVELGYHFEECGLRAHYWHYDEEQLPEGGMPGIYGLQFDVLDLEATKQVGDFTISGGFRYADWGLSTSRYPDGAGGFVAATSTGTNEFGVTIAAEGDTAFFSGEDWSLSAVYGGRLSLLRGHWTYNSQPGLLPYFGNIGTDTQDVLEVWTGLEGRYGCAFARTALEMQRWHSDDMDAHGWQDIGFLGIGTTVGVRF